MRKDSKRTQVSLYSIREQALEDAAKSVKSIRIQRELEPDNELVRNAVRNSEEAMFFLVSNESEDDDERYREILVKHNLADIR